MLAGRRAGCITACIRSYMPRSPRAIRASRLVGASGEANLSTPMNSPESALILISRKVRSPSQALRRPSWSPNDSVEAQARTGVAGFTRAPASASDPNTASKASSEGSSVARIIGTVARHHWRPLFSVAAQ